jgi:pimeloyl-ACP methyl ester carboxylesterase
MWQVLPKTEAELAARQEEIRSQVRSMLHYKEQHHPLDARLIVTTQREGYRVEKIKFLSEPDIYIPAWVFVPEGRNGVLPSVVYLSDEGMQNDGMEFAGGESAGLTRGVLDELARKGYLVIAVDVRGIGETRSAASPSLASNEFGQLFDTDTSMAYAAWFMDRSLLGMRVQDVVRSVDYAMQRQGADGRNLHLIGKGNAGLWCLYAAALDVRIRSLICVRSLISYRSLAQADRYLYGADVFVPEILLHLDLPQVAAAVAPRPLTLIEPADAMKKIVDSAQAEENYLWTRAAYEAAASDKHFRIEREGQGLSTADHYLSLLQAAND